MSYTLEFLEIFNLADFSCSLQEMKMRPYILTKEWAENVRLILCQYSAEWNELISISQLQLNKLFCKQ